MLPRDPPTRLELRVMWDIPPELASISNSREVLGCYSGLVSASAHVFAPESIPELVRIFAFARAKKCRITFRAGGHSFDGQAIGDDLVVSLLALDRIDVDVANR